MGLTHESVFSMNEKRENTYDKVLRNRITLLSEEIPSKMAIHSTLITTYGLKYNEYSGAFVNVIDMDALFD